MRHREAQLAAMLEVDQAPAGEVLTFSTATPQPDRWLQRTVSRVGEHLAALRDRVLDAAALQRHSLVLDVNAASGLLTWEALRRAPEGGVWALTYEPPRPGRPCGSRPNACRTSNALWCWWEILCSCRHLLAAAPEPGVAL